VEETTIAEDVVVVLVVVRVVPTLAAQDDHDALEILRQRSPLPVNRGGVVFVNW
jgi:hypothetical protein